MKISTSIIFCVLLVFIFSISSSSLEAQTVSDSLNPSKEYSSYNQNKIYENHIAHQKTVWRRISLKEKQNQPFFVKGNEISKVIIEAVLLEKLQPYRNDSLKIEMSSETFSENLTVPQEEITHQGDSEEFFTQYDWSQNDDDWNEEISKEELQYECHF